MNRLCFCTHQWHIPTLLSAASTKPATRSLLRVLFLSIIDNLWLSYWTATFHRKFWCCIFLVRKKVRNTKTKWRSSVSSCEDVNYVLQSVTDTAIREDAISHMFWVSWCFIYAPTWLLLDVRTTSMQQTLNPNYYKSELVIWAYYRAKVRINVKGTVIMTEAIITRSIFLVLFNCWTVLIHHYLKDILCGFVVLGLSHQVVLLHCLIIIMLTLLPVMICFLLLPWK